MGAYIEKQKKKEEGENREKLKENVKEGESDTIGSKWGIVDDLTKMSHVIFCTFNLWP